MAELHSALGVAVRCPGTVPRWPSRLIADSVPRRLAVAPFLPNMCSIPCDEDVSRIMIICTQTAVFVLISTLFEHRSTCPDSCAHGTPEVTVIGDVTAAR